VFRKLIRLLLPSKPIVWLIGLGVSLVLTPLFRVLDNEGARAAAYRATSSFAPWNLAARYLQIVLTQCDVGAATICEESPLSRGTGLGFKLFTGVADVVLHAFTTGGVVGFAFALAQVVIGLVATLALFRRGEGEPPHGFYFYAVGLPLGAMLVGSVAAIPVWVVAWLSVTALNGAPLVGLGLQTFSVSTLCTAVCVKAAESVTHEVAVKTVTKTLNIDPD
jgi:hypothetical protein